MVMHSAQLHASIMPRFRYGMLKWMPMRSNAIRWDGARIAIMKSVYVTAMFHRIELTEIVLGNELRQTLSGRGSGAMLVALKQFFMKKRKQNQNENMCCYSRIKIHVSEDDLYVELVSPSLDHLNAVVVLKNCCVYRFLYAFYSTVLSTIATPYLLCLCRLFLSSYVCVLSLEYFLFFWCAHIFMCLLRSCTLISLLLLLLLLQLLLCWLMCHSWNKLQCNGNNHQIHNIFNWRNKYVT